MRFWRGLSLHFRLTIAMLAMLAFLIASGLIGIVSVDDALSPGGAEDLRRTVSLRLGVLMVLGLATVLISAWVASRSLRRPLNELKHAAEVFSSGDLDYRIPITGTDELTEVQRMFNTLAGALRDNQEDLTHQAFHDPLTALPNRALFRDRVEHALTRLERDRKPLAILLIDLDDFKRVNDSLGHAAGDRLLMSVADALRTVLRPADTAARLGGDEFAVLIEDMRGRYDVMRVAQRILDAFTGSVDIEHTELQVRGSIGIAISYGGESVDDVLRNADTAMYAAKEQGKNRLQVYDGSMHHDALQRLDLKAELRAALANQEFEVHYSPVADIVTRRVLGAEAALRWIHPVRGPIAAEDFLTIAGETGVTRELGRWVMQEAASQLREWQMAYDGSFSMSVEVAGKHLTDPAFSADLEAALAGATVSAESIFLEVSESALMEDEDTIAARLRAARALGVHITIDDFGTGFSPIAYLRRLPVEGVKMHATFTAGVTQGPEESALARAVVKLADTLGLTVTAGGVDDEERATALVELGCTRGQGELFGGPLPAQAFERLLDHPTVGLDL